MIQKTLFYPGLSSFIDRYDSFIVDLWGVIHDGYQPFPFVLNTLQNLSQKGKEVVFLSNSPRRSSVLRENLRALKIPDSLYKALHSSGEDAYEALSQPREGLYRNLGHKVYALSQPIHQSLYYDLDLQTTETLQDADFILNTGPQNINIDDYRELLRQAQALKLPMVCVNPDISVVHGGQLILCAGSLAQFYQEIGGEVRYHGKPYPEVYHSVIQMFKSKDLNCILAIGDSLFTDIKGGNSLGIDTALVMTGLFEREFGQTFDPDSQMQKLERVCHEKGVKPTYLIPQFQW